MTCKCPVCKSTLYGFNWVKTVNGSNWMQNEQQEWHDCPMSPPKFGESKVKWTKTTKHDYYKCELCPGWLVTIEAHHRLPMLWYISKEDHMRVFHPNNEKLSARELFEV